MQLQSLATDFHFALNVDMLPWTECYVLLATYDPTWKGTSGTSLDLAKAAAVLLGGARSDFWATQNVTWNLAPVR
jgi:hypothetical protein